MAPTMIFAALASDACAAFSDAFKAANSQAAYATVTAELLASLDKRSRFELSPRSYANYILSLEQLVELSYGEVEIPLMFTETIPERSGAKPPAFASIVVAIGQPEELEDWLTQLVKVNAKLIKKFSAAAPAEEAEDDDDDYQADDGEDDEYGYDDSDPLERFDSDIHAKFIKHLTFCIKNELVAVMTIPVSA